MVCLGTLRRLCVGAVRADRVLISPLRFLGFCWGLGWLKPWPPAWLEPWLTEGRGSLSSPGPVSWAGPWGHWGRLVLPQFEVGFTPVVPQFWPAPD
jgi:hypothetical protein